MFKPNRIAQGLLLCLMIAVFFWLRAVTAPEFSSLSALDAQQKSEGFVPIGRFGESWPATVVEVREQDDRIEFKRSDGQQHNYQGFEGYRLKMIRLLSRTGTEVIAVYRSEPTERPAQTKQNNKPVIRRL